MKTSDFYFDLPQSSIAQHPLKERDLSKLMVIDRANDEVSHFAFKDIVDFIAHGDCLVLNNSRVMPARIYGTRTTGAKVEFLLLNEKTKDHWACLVKPGRKAKIGDTFDFGGMMTGKVLDIIEDGLRVVQFDYDGIFFDILDQIGAMPLPPYITETLEDNERYQTIYNKYTGSAAAPTAGLHFTERVMDKLRAKGVSFAYVTLHVGLGTFRPVKVDDVDDHHMHSEWYELKAEDADIINQTKANGGRVIAVGTTSVRTLESVARKCGEIKADADWTDIFIYPGYQFKVVDALITNFHLPESTLLMLVSALYDKDKILSCYELAVKENYRFFSFGDSMFIK